MDRFIKILYKSLLWRYYTSYHIVLSELEIELATSLLALHYSLTLFSHCNLYVLWFSSHKVDYAMKDTHSLILLISLSIEKSIIVEVYAYVWEI